MATILSSQERRPQIRTLIADDEMLARQGLRVRLEKESDIDVIGETVDGPTTVTAIRPYDRIPSFLDVRMPGCDGFEVLKRVASEFLPSVVLSRRMISMPSRRSEVHALDYLLKPSIRAFRSAAAAFASTWRKKRRLRARMGE